MAKSKEFADQLTKVAMMQRVSSAKAKQQRMRDIEGSEKLYAGDIEPSLRSRFNVPFPTMAGSINSLMANIDDPPAIKYERVEEADLKKAKKTTAAWDSIKNRPEMKLELKDRWMKKMAAFSGRGILAVHGDSSPYDLTIRTVDYKYFHCEAGARGAGHLENHLYTGEDNIFKTRAALLEGSQSGLYNKINVALILAGGNEDSNREVVAEEVDVFNRQRSLGIDVESTNYTGERLYNLTQWNLEWKGRRYYLLYDSHSQLAVRCELLKDVFSDDRFPYVSFATHEDPEVFWSQAYADEIRPIAEVINIMLNQELTNRDKQNDGRRYFDPSVFKNPARLDENRPGGLIPAHLTGGKNLDNSIKLEDTPQLNDTLGMVNFIKGYLGREIGISPGVQGVSEKDKRVGVFFGELEKAGERFGMLNKSYSEMYVEFGSRVLTSFKDHLHEGQAIKMIGAEGLEFPRFEKSDLKTEGDLDIKVVSGNADAELNATKTKQKFEALVQIGKDPALVQEVNSKWRAEQILRTGYDDPDIAFAMDTKNYSDQELMADVRGAIEEVIKGKKPTLIRNMTTGGLQRIYDFAQQIRDEGNKDIAIRLLAYGDLHLELTAINMARKAQDVLAKQPLPEEAEGGDSPTPATQVNPLSNPAVQANSEAQSEAVR